MFYLCLLTKNIAFGNKNYGYEDKMSYKVYKKWKNKNKKKIEVNMALILT